MYYECNDRFQGQRHSFMFLIEITYPSNLFYSNYTQKFMVDHNTISMYYEGNDRLQVQRHTFTLLIEIMYPICAHFTQV